MTETENVFRLHTLDTNAQSRFLLSVYMPMPFGMGKNVFLVDYLVHTVKDTVQGTRNDGSLVVEFPNTFQYMLINRDQYEVITMDEAKRQMKEAESEEEGPSQHTALDSPGQYV